MISRHFGSTTTGRGLPAVVGYLNGVAMPQWGDWSLVAVKIVTTVLTTASGIPMGQFGILVEIGAMIGAMTLVQNRVTARIDFLKHFRNPRDKRLIVNVGLAAGVTAAFQSPMGGLLVVLELLTSRFPVKFAAYVFTGCVLCAFTVQVLATYFDGFSLRARDGLPATQMDPMSEQLQVELNYALTVPTVVIATLCSAVAALYSVTVNWLGRLFHDAEDRRPSKNLIAAAIGLAAVYNVVTVMLSYVFGGEYCVVPERTAYEFDATFATYGNSSLPLPNGDGLQQTVSLGLTTNVFCQNKTGTAVFGTAASDPVNTFASMALTFPEQAFRLMIQRKFALDPSAVAAYLPVLFVGSCFFSSLLNVVNGDTLLPCAVMGGCIGHLVYAAQLHIPGLTAAWVNSGVYALIGAAAFLSAVNHMTFSLVFLMVDVSGDVRHVVFVMLAVAVARFVTKHALRLDSLEHSILRIMACPLLDFADRIATRDDLTLHRFQSPHGRLIFLRANETAAFLLKMLSENTHNAFPLVAPDGRSLIGVVHRSTIELILWRNSEVPPKRLRAKHRVGGNDAGRADQASPPPGGSSDLGATGTSGESGRWVPTTLEPRAEGVTLAHQFESMAVPPASRGYGGGGGGHHHWSPVGTPTVVPVESFSQLGNNAPADATGGAAPGDEFDALRDLETWLARCRLQYGEPRAQCGRSGAATSAQPTPLDGAEAKRSHAEAPKPLPTLQKAYDDGPFEALAQRVNLARYADRSPFIVRVESSAGRAYQLFNVLGARHLILVDFKGQPRGILTRLDLLREVFQGKRREERLAQEQQYLVPTDSERSVSPDGLGSGVSPPMPGREGEGERRAGDDPTHRSIAQPPPLVTTAGNPDTTLVRHVETAWDTNAFSSPAQRGHGGASPPMSPSTQGRLSANVSFAGSVRVTERPALLLRSMGMDESRSMRRSRGGAGCTGEAPRQTPSAHASMRSARRAVVTETPAVAEPGREMSLRAVESPENDGTKRIAAASAASASTSSSRASNSAGSASPPRTPPRAETAAASAEDLRIDDAPMASEPRLQEPQPPPPAAAAVGAAESATPRKE
jgi:chloride channel 7